MIVRAVELREANAFVARHHRHHQPVRGHRFSLGAYRDGQLVGVVIVGRPVAQTHRGVLEVTRLCTDGTHNACSLLYAAAARAGKALGYERIQTYILDSEPGTSLRASGWLMEKRVKGDERRHNEARQLYLNGKTRRDDHPLTDKQRWAKVLTRASARQSGHPEGEGEK